MTRHMASKKRSTPAPAPVERRGGARHGAGRKRKTDSQRVQSARVTGFVSPDDEAKIEALCTVLGLTHGQLFAHAISWLSERLLSDPIKSIEYVKALDEARKKAGKG